MIYHRKSDEPLSIAEKFSSWGKAILVASALLGGGYTVVSRTVTTIKAGPEAKAQTDILNIRVTKLERESTYVVHGIEKLTHTKYQPDDNE